MSSTNRGYDRHASDYYVTPTNEIKKFWKEFKKHTDDFCVITINILGVPTPFDINIAKQFFEIRMEVNV